MTQLVLDTSFDLQQSLFCGLTPSGQITIRQGSIQDGPALAPATGKRILAAFSKSRGHGVLHLGAAELSTDLGPTLGFWRELGQSLVDKVCVALDPTAPKAFVVPEPDPDELDALAHAAPPMQGAELLANVRAAGSRPSIARLAHSACRYAAGACEPGLVLRENSNPVKSRLGGVVGFEG